MDQAVEQPRLVQIIPPTLDEAWQMVLSQLHGDISPANYNTWVQPLRPVSFKEGVFRIVALTTPGRDWVVDRLLSRLTKLLEGIYAQPVTVRVGVAFENAGQADAEADDTPPVRLEKMKTTTAGSKNGSGPNGTAMPAARTTVPTVAPAVPVAEPPAPGTSAAASAPVKPEKKKAPAPADEAGEAGSPRKMQLQRAYGTARARVIQPERGMFLTMYFFNNWLPLLGHSAMTTVIAARSLCYWNPMTGELRNVVETDMSELAKRASVSVRTVKDVLNNELIKKYFLRYKVRRIMTSNGVRTAGIILQVRMDDPLTPEDQDTHSLPEEERWYTADFEDETED